MNIASLISEKLNSQQNEQDKQPDEIDKELENIINHPTPPYHEKSYWNDRYKREPQPFEWYQPFSRLKDIMTANIPKDSQVLNVGCGNSTLNEEILKLGASNVTGIDFSDIVINQMKDKYKEEGRLKWVIGDCTKLSFEDSSFDVVVDKGTLDSIIVSLDTVNLANDMLREVCRVLKPGGIFIEVTYGTPNTRASVISSASQQWELKETKEVPKPIDPNTYHYVYIFQKTK